MSGQSETTGSPIRCDDNGRCGYCIRSFERRLPLVLEHQMLRYCDATSWWLFAYVSKNCQTVLHCFFRDSREFRLTSAEHSRNDILSFLLRLSRNLVTLSCLLGVLNEQQIAEYFGLFASLVRNNRLTLQECIICPTRTNGMSVLLRCLLPHDVLECTNLRVFDAFDYSVPRIHKPARGIRKRCAVCGFLGAITAALSAIADVGNQNDLGVECG